MVGLLIGPAIGGALALWTYSAIYLCSGLGSILATLALLRLPETKPAVLETAETAETPPRWWMSRGILVPCFCLMAAGMLFSMYDVVWPQYLASRGVGPFLIGLSISIFALPVLLLATTAGRLSDRANRRLLVACAFVIVASTAALYPELHSYPVILLVGLFEALGFMIVEPSLFAVLSECASTDIRGRAMGLGGFFQFGGGAFGAGFLGSLFGLSEGLPFWAGACFAVLAAAVSALWMPARRLKTGSPESLPQIQAMELETQI
jgi:DHA1 family multidrug resistance protein-like MFS transporter